MFNLDDKQIIDNWIKMQHGFFITSSNLDCPICRRNVTNHVITKRSGFCMRCFIEQIVISCKKVRPVRRKKASAKGE